MLMLRNRSRAVTSKQTRMTEHGSLPSPQQNQTTPISSLLGSPSFFNGFLTRSISDVECAISPTSILDSKNFSNSTSPFGYDKNSLRLSSTCTENKHAYEKVEGIGLALIDSKDGDEDDENVGKPRSKMVLFGAKLKVQIPPLPSSDVSPKSPADFGIKTRNSQLLGTPSAFGSPNPYVKAKESPQAVAEVLSLSEMELSEDYTCVITHGPNPKTTHIFDDCIVKSCCGVGNLSDPEKEYGLPTDKLASVPVNFLRFCCACKDKLGDISGKDINMIRGEKAFCSDECRCHEVLVEGVKRSEPEEDLTTQ